MAQLPQKDPRWCGMMEAIDLRRQQTQSLQDAIIPLEQAMASGKLPWMRVNVVTGEAESPDFHWNDHRLDFVVEFRSVSIYRLEGRGDGFRQWNAFDHYPHTPVEGYVYHVWQPAFDRLFGAGAQADDNAADEPLKPIDRAEAVLRDLYRTKADVTDSLKTITGAVAEECDKRGWQAPSADTVQRALESLEYRPPRSRG